MRRLPPVRLGQLGRVPVDAHAGWLLWLPLGVMSLALGPLDTAQGDEPRLTRWLLATCAVVLMAFSVWLHELGHVATAVLHRLPLHHITLYPWGGITRMAFAPIPLLPFLHMTLAGPLVSFGLAGLWLGLWWVGDVLVLRWVAAFNLLLALLNLLPLPRLDGSRLLWLVKDRVDPAAVTAVTLLLSVGLTSILFFSGGGAFLAGLFLPDGALAAQGMLLILAGLWLQSPGHETAHIGSRAHIIQWTQTPVRALLPELAERVPVNGRLPSQSLPAPASNRPAFAGQQTHPTPPLLQPWVVHPTTSLAQALDKLNGRAASTLLVVDGYHIVGAVSHDQIWQHLVTPSKKRPLSHSSDLFILLKPQTKGKLLL